MTRRHLPLLAFVAASLWGSVTAFSQTPVDSGWTYQGRLTDNGAPANGPYDLRFSLYSNSAGTIMVGAVQNLAGVPVSAGLFTVNLSFPNQFAGSKRWLKLEISPAGAGTYTALPLQEITSAPQAIFAQTLGLPFTANGNVASPGAVFTISNSGTGYSLRAQNDSPSGGVGMYGLAAAGTGANTGGRFESNSTSGYGVIGYVPAATGTTFGVYAQSDSVSGYGVYGQANATSGSNIGVYGLTHSTTGSGVQGFADSTTGFNFGGHFFTNSPDGRAVRAVNNALTGLAVAGRFGTGSPAGISVWTTASATSGVNYGIYADSNSAAGYGGYFFNSAVGGTALWANGLAKVKTLQILGGADLAEPFNVNTDAATGPAQPGMVVVIDAAKAGDLCLTDRAYDTRVAGVISGANGLEPGMVMKAVGHTNADGEHPVAMTGRVWCFVDASFGEIVPGDRLTTSTTPGHAMKAEESARCGGAVIGKAMTELKEGKGLVLVLVNLQ